MEIERTELILKNGRACVLRSAGVDDAEDMLMYLKKVGCESEYLQRSEDDPVPGLEEERQFIQANLDSPTKCYIGAYIDGRFAGGCNLLMGSRKKIAHRTQIGIAVLKEFWGMGIGSLLFEKAEEVARKKGLKQIELSCISGNERGLALYQKRGFAEVGRMPNAYLLSDGEWHDEIFMVKVLY